VRAVVPSLSRYACGASASLASSPEDLEIDCSMRRVSLLPQGRAQQQSTAPVPMHEAAPPMMPESADVAVITFSSSGEEVSVLNTAHPSAVILLASRQHGQHDDNDDNDEGGLARFVSGCRYGVF
jgi:hypothetical protein